MRLRAALGAAGVASALVLGGCGGSADPSAAPTGSSPPSPSRPAEPPTATPTSTPEPVPAEVVPAVPTRVTIPGIEVARDLVDLGLAADGSMEVPTDFADIGWFTGGGRPGGRGPLVIAAHVDSRDGPAAFYRLRDVAVGDVVEVTNAEGALTTYRVDAVEAYPKDAFPTTEVFGATPDDQLRLITCDGDFDRSQRSYVDNLVVYATAVA